MADILSDYILETRRLLHDALGNYWSDNDLIAYVNRAREHVVTDTGALRTLQTPTFQASTEQFVFGGVTAGTVTAGGSGFADGTYSLVFTNATGDNGSGATGTYTCAGGAVTSIKITAQGVRYQTAPTLSFPSGGGTGATGTASILQANTVDVINLTVIWNNQRIPMRNFAFTELSAFGRPWTTYTYTPGAFALYGKSVYVAPMPNAAYAMEADTVVLPAALSGKTDGPLVSPETEAVAYWAAYLAKLNEGQDVKAEQMRQLYMLSINWANTIYTRRGQSVYYNNANIAE